MCPGPLYRMYTVCLTGCTFHEDFFFQFCSAGLLLMMSWRGGSHLTVFWSVKVRPLTPLIVLSKAALSQFLILSLSLCLFSFLPSQFCTARPCKSWWIALGASLGGSRIYSPLKFIKPIWKIYLRRTTLAEIRSVIWPAGVDRMISTNSYSFIKPAPARGYHLTTFLPFFWKWQRWQISSFFFSLFPLPFVSHYSTEMNSAHL